MIRCVRIWTGKDGNSLFEEGTIELPMQLFPEGAHGKGFMDRALDNGLAFLRRVLDGDHQAYAQLSQEET